LCLKKLAHGGNSGTSVPFSSFAEDCWNSLNLLVPQDDPFSVIHSFKNQLVIPFSGYYHLNELEHLDGKK
jgi:hypothetical protein